MSEPGWLPAGYAFLVSTGHANNDNKTPED